MKYLLIYCVTFKKKIHIANINHTLKSSLSFFVHKYKVGGNDCTEQLNVLLLSMKGNISIKTERFCLSFAEGSGWSQVGLRLGPKTCLVETGEQLLWCCKFDSNSSASS